MAKHPLSKREDERQLTRRALIKWSVAAGAALGVSRSKIFEILEGSADKDLAFAASANPTCRSIHVVAGNGGLAWFGLLWPMPEIALSGNAQFSYHKPGMATAVAGTDKTYVTGPDTPFATLTPDRQMTIFTCGSNETHTAQPTSVTGLNGANIFSVASALQSVNPSVIPFVTLGDVEVGTAPGGARPANVNNADGIVGLFNSAASRANGLLAATSDAQLYKAHYEALIQLNRAANRSTTKTAYLTAQGAAKFLGTNLSAKLSVTPEDLTRYGITGATRANVAAIGRTFIVAVKAFRMGLTNSVVLPAMRDDPHGAFDSGDVNTVPAQLKGIFDGLMADLKGTVDDNTQQALDTDTVITVHGDTTKTFLNKSGWGDGTTGNTNRVYVWSAGHLLSGNFGQVKANNTAEGFDANGAPAAYNGANTARFAMASIAYALAKRDERAIGAFANGIAISGKFGRAKEI